jgi:SPP1 gp7 family putative phage head morphogenesis protein
MNSRDYWERRAAQDMYDRMGTAEETAAEMNAAINQTSAYLEKEVKAVMRGMQSFGISEAEAKKILNAAGGDGSALQRLRKAAQQVSDPERREALLNAINSAGAYRYRITRIEELNKDINRRCRELYKTENRHVTSALRNVAEDSYYREIFSIQKGTGLGFSFSKFPRQDVDRILRSNWSGGNYSQRIWKDVSGMTARLKSELLVSMLSGRSGEKTARIFQEQFGVNAFCARRIVRTESAYVANAAQAKAYGEAGIERYRFVATLDSRTCECCAALDGKVFDLAKAKPGTNYPPMHPFCRSTTIADFGDDELKGLERRARDKDGNTVKVPAGMTYEQWKEKYVDPQNSDPAPTIPIAGINCRVEEKKYCFGYNTSVQSNAVVYTTPDGVSFIFPKNYDSAHQTMTPEQAISCWQKVPEEVKKKAQKNIEFVDYYNPDDSYWKRVYKNFTHSYATGGDKITFYRYDRPHDSDYVVRTYCHEAGHYIDTNLSVSGGRFSEEKEWKKAIAEDKKLSGSKSPTAYGENSPAEDFAESIAEYAQNAKEFSKKFPNRASILKNKVL